MKKWITSFLQYGTLISSLGFILSVLLQIFARFLLPSAPAWTEEASRLFFIYAISFSAGLAFQSQEYVYLDWIFHKLSHKWQSLLKLMIETISLILFLVIFYHSLAFVVLGNQETSPGLGIPMSYIFFSMLILSGSLSFYLVLDLIQTIKNSKSIT